MTEDTDESLVYTGQAGVRKNGEGILYRLQEHKRNPDKEYWTEAVVFTTSNNSFGPTEISYLENRFCNMALDANRYIVKNANEPTSGNITEEKESELEEFLEYAKIVMGTLGHKVFDPLVNACEIIEPLNEVVQKEIRLYLKRKIRKSGRVIEAICKQTNEGFVVLSGSSIEIIGSDSIPPAIKRRREQAKIDKDGKLQEDSLFKSPSYAAAFVIGGHANGMTEWKTKDGRTLATLDKSSG